MNNDSEWLDKQQPCPNCHGEGRIVLERFDDGDVWYRPECNCCKLGWQENYPTIKEAVEAWNGAGELTVHGAGPLIEVASKEHARWIYFRNANGIKQCKCSECLTSYGCMDTPYCPNCGVVMDLESEDKDE